MTPLTSSHRDKLLSSFRKHGEIAQVRTLNEIPRSDYVYGVVNGDNVLQIGKSTASEKNKGRLKLLMNGSLVGKHNKAFVCGLYPAIAGVHNEFFVVVLKKGDDKAAAESMIHQDMGLTTNTKAATLIDDFGIESLPTYHKALWERFKRTSIYVGMDSIEKAMSLELYELVTFGQSRIKRSSGAIVSSKQGDNLEGNILKCLDKRYLTTIWLKMCNGYFRYGNAHAIPKEEFEKVKKNYHYEEQGRSFTVYGASR